MYICHMDRGSISFIIDCGRALQLANVTASVRGAGEGDLTAAAAAAVGIATTAVDAALLNVEQAVGRAGQNKQVTRFSPSPAWQDAWWQLKAVSLLRGFVWM